MTADERIRIFCALRLFEDTLDMLVRWQDGLHGDMRVVERPNLHVTLAFLGHRARSELDAIIGVLRDCARAAEPIVFEALRYHETRSVGMLVLDDVGGHATELAGRVHAGLEQLGVYRREERAWLPHITIVRFRERPRLRPELPRPGRFAPSDAAAFLSRLSPRGARYEVLESVVLGG